MNTIQITGRLTADPECKHTQSGVAVCSYTLAVKRPKVKDVTDFLPIVSWRQGAEYLCQYAHKGDMIAATGTLTARKWQDKDGNNRVSYEVQTDTVEILSPRRESKPAAVNVTRDDYEEVVGADDDDLPFLR